ncbi:ATP12-domain-containing protein [Rickenella mellea]|uniref:ATP12-domain-containing protein n=1 Tax=Rickenella mellea TaxID=50990 RepID=A0A4Y7QK26_9AGAM|nr:ATP12-domain-containing protein [Rickenella mellea]
MSFVHRSHVSSSGQILYRIRRSVLQVREYATHPALDGPTLSETNRAEASLTRFWKEVGIERTKNGFSITLDKRPLKTPSGNLLIVPTEKKLLATLIANEWENQRKVLKPHALPITSLTSRAIDGLTDEGVRDDVHSELLKYFDTDTICFHNDEPPVLAQLQENSWSPVLSWTREEFDVEVLVFRSLLNSGQPAATKEALKNVLESFDEWQIAGMERATYVTKSFIIALALVKGRLSVEDAAQAAHVEVNSQIKRWGEVEDTHDVDFHDVRRQLGSVACLLSES